SALRAKWAALWRFATPARASRCGQSASTTSSRVRRCSGASASSLTRSSARRCSQASAGTGRPSTATSNRPSMRTSKPGIGRIIPRPGAAQRGAPADEEGFGKGLVPTVFPHRPGPSWPGPKEIAMQVTHTVNGVDIDRLLGTIDAIKSDPALAKFQFRVRNEWIDGAHARATIKDFYGAGQEDTSRTEPFVVDVDEPPVLLGTNQAPSA